MASESKEPEAAPPAAAVGGGAEAADATEQKRFEVKKWNAVALWAWGTSTKRARARSFLLPPACPRARPSAHPR